MAIYLVAYYRALGVVAVLSLLIAGGVLYLTLVVMSKTIGLTLTLAGVAGAIVAIGITADSFIVYFERIRDEIREGRRCGRPATPAGSGPAARCWRPTSSRSWPPSSCTCCPSAACAASPSSSG